MRAETASNSSITHLLLGGGVAKRHIMAAEKGGSELGVRGVGERMEGHRRSPFCSKLPLSLFGRIEIHQHRNQRSDKKAYHQGAPLYYRDGIDSILGFHTSPAKPVRKIISSFRKNGKVEISVFTRRFF